MNWEGKEGEEMAASGRNGSLSEEMKDQIMMVADKMGMDKAIMTDKMMWGMKESMMGGMKMMDEMKSQGMDDEQAMQMMGKFSDAMMDPQMMDKMKMMKEKPEGM